MKKKMAVLICLLLVSSMVLTTAAVTAKKPPKPDPDPTPEGTLYMIYADDGVNWVWSMPADGSNMAKDHVWSGGYQAKYMSHPQHGGNWWYIGWKAVGTTPYPDGEPRWEIFAVSSDGTTEVQLTDDANMEMNYLSIVNELGINDDTVGYHLRAMVADGDLHSAKEGRYTIYTRDT